jgi:ubiquinone/menaquinone biosynthesis C-methylase UbiE
VKTKEHWEHVYQTKASAEVSWFQDRPRISLRLIGNTGIQRSQSIIDVGGGASILVDELLNAEFRHVAVLDISSAALEQSRKRLGPQAAGVEWFDSDVTQFTASHRYDLWHDRAVFHFLTEKSDREKYVNTLERTLASDGHVIMATFSLDGPVKCSGLDVRRYDANGIHAELGVGFKLREQVDETHVTPWNTEQKFSYFRFART